MSEQILTGTAAQLGYTVPFTLVHAGKYRTEDKLKNTDNIHKHKKRTTQNTAKQNYPGSVASYDTWPGNEVGLFYNAAKPMKTTRNINTSAFCRCIYGPTSSPEYQ